MAKCWTEEENEYMRKHYGKRYTYQEMAERLGRTAPAIGHRLTRIDMWTEEAM